MYSFESQEERERNHQPLPNDRNSQVWTRSNQEPATLFWAHTWMAGVQIFGPFSTAFSGASVGSQMSSAAAGAPIHDASVTGGA